MSDQATEATERDKELVAAFAYGIWKVVHGVPDEWTNKCKYGAQNPAVLEGWKRLAAVQLAALDEVRERREIIERMVIKLAEDNAELQAALKGDNA